ncbi:DUF6083 domain-containing protein [[Kitasatospora] papulosa]|uniref:DUF6083 domain-containing protein n=1 Tax=[Kitasatospora] papulosa TaxID=1464011 RepID=UPI0039083765
MRPHPRTHRWSTRQHPSPGMTLHGPGGLPRAGRCRQCANPVVWHPRGDQRLIALHPAELPTTHVPGSWRWHLSSGIAHPHAGGQAWCRIPHTALCPASTPLSDAPRPVQNLRRQLALRSRRLTDAASLTPPATPLRAPRTGALSAVSRPVVQLLLGRYLADDSLERIQCVAAAGPDGQRCPRPVQDPHTPTGTWRLLPLYHPRGAAARPARLMAVYDLTWATPGDQRRWRAQRCPEHAAVRPDLTNTGWQVFNPVGHTVHIHTRLPHPGGPTPA